jgi:hypothetical protein
MVKKTKTMPKSAPKPVPTQDETQFKASLVVDAKPTMKESDIFVNMTDGQKKRAVHRQALKDRMVATKKAKEKRKNKDK